MIDVRIQNRRQRSKGKVEAAGGIVYNNYNELFGFWNLNFGIFT